MVTTRETDIEAGGHRLHLRAVTIRSETTIKCSWIPIEPREDGITRLGYASLANERRGLLPRPQTLPGRLPQLVTQGITSYSPPDIALDQVEEMLVAIALLIAY